MGICAVQLGRGVGQVHGRSQPRRLRKRLPYGREGEELHLPPVREALNGMPVANEEPAMPPPTMTMSHLVGANGISQNRCSACHANRRTLARSSDHQQNLTAGALFGQSLSLGRVAEWKLPAYGDAQFAISDGFGHELENFCIRG